MLECLVSYGSPLCWYDPKAELFSVRPWCSGTLYGVLQERHVPLLIDYFTVSPDDLDVVLSQFPGLRVILLNAPRQGRNRMLYPLLQRHSGLYLCLSHTYSVHRGYEDLCKTFGPDRWVFGMGYPKAEPGAALAGLTFADISDEAKQCIAYKNLEALMEDSR
jgi:predicted TIM-barrel fold metal-dependent hydrolase